ncbi:fumarylacetoacetate hydrolase family protein [Microbacterium sp. ASV49]|uniref:Fumarylacetoacetate hydrolase family protein n=1 Tax=Microbacterium candidum TaxID=3041922 RepID=A0ABT7N3N9_9MICO|nr:fumarylacetoacetate hydrolase family protein [Microbacterium sp. ASV49]MDL9981323.1 fumarylacetoacetate hydrolase family protein [Microbacterium sp. ASV49]
MRLATVLVGASTRAAAGDDDGWVVLDERDAQALIAEPGWRVRVEAALHDRERVRLEPEAFLTPMPRPAKVLCCGLNYRDHIVETGRAVPEYPTLFAKFADTLTGPVDDIVVHDTERLDWEAELVVVVGAEVHRATRDEARAAILGYTVSNDISMRDWQQRTLQWVQGKAFDGTTPVGPVVVTADAVEPREGLRITCAVNGETMQDGNTRELVFDAADLLAYVSQITRLRPGDLILTGTPGGVALGMPEPRWLRDGDIVTTAIEGIGELRNTVRFE